MTISSAVRTAGPFTGTGALSTYSFAFKVFQASDLLVVRQLISTGAQTTLALTTDYTVSLNADQDSSPGGSITLVAGALATTYTLLITSDVGNLQPTSLTNQGGFYPEVINDSLDRATIQIQQVAVKSGREMSAPLIDGTIDMTLPSAANRASKFLYFGASGEPMAAAGTNTGNNTSPGNLTLTANNAGSNTARDVIFYDNTTETMRILGSGATSKVGIGIASPATKLHVSGASVTTEQIYLANSSSNSYLASMVAGSTGVPGSGVPANSVWIEGVPASSGNTYLSSYNNNLAFATGSSRTERMRIDSSGRVGIGMTPTTRQFSLYSATNPTFQIVNSTTGTDAGDGGIIYMSGSDMLVTNQEAANLKFETQGTTRVTIDSAGDVFVGQTTALISGMHSVVGDGTTGMLALKNSGNAQVWQTGPALGGNFYVATSAGVGMYMVAAATAWTATSDERKKDIIEPIANGLDKVDSLRAVIGKFKTDATGVRRAFLIAQDVQAVLPEAVDAESDADGTLGLRYTDTIPLLVSAIKELKAIVEAQAARIAALETRA